VELENGVEVLRAGASTWDAGSPGQVLHTGDQLRTAERSRAVVRLANQTTLRVGELTVLRIPAQGERGGVVLEMLRGVLYFFRRDKPDLFEIRTGSVSAVVRGTEFTIREEGEGATVHLLDGELVLSNEHGSLALRGGESAMVEVGRAPGGAAVLDPFLAVQWCAYYPAIVDPAELTWTRGEAERLRDVFAAYGEGDLQAAGALWPVRRGGLAEEWEGDAAKVFHAAVLLAVGGAAEAERLLPAQAAVHSDGATSAEWIGLALGRMIEVVRGRDPGAARPPRLAAEWMAESYARQRVGDLRGARAAALEAARVSEGFGFAWVRVAELEFSHGRLKAAEVALARGIGLTPRNAQALALRGFLAAGRGRTLEALEWFERAIRMDSGLGNGWLGRGLCRIRRGEVREGIWDLQVAATVEPQRSVLRSYLAKGLAEGGQWELARRELGRARELDPGDPTPWLYSALMARQELRANEAIEDLETSRVLNDNRALYRSRLLLDQDRAVRSANLAVIYDDAGMADVAFREASRAVMADYANYSGHLFLANSYDALSDPQRVNLRYESATLSEYLIANLLAPPGAGTLSRTLSQQEYSPLFDRDRLRLISSTEYRSAGDWIHDTALSGSWRDSSAALEGGYRSERGQRPNNDLEHWRVSTAVREHLTVQDTIYLQAAVAGTAGGDLRMLYDPAEGNPELRFREDLEPAILAGYRREWTPESQTLVLGSWLANSLEQWDPYQPLLFLGAGTDGAVDLIAQPALPTASQTYELQTRVWSLEAQHILCLSAHTAIAGVRYQTGAVDVDSALGSSTPTQLGNTTGTLPFFFSTPELAQNLESEFERVGIYAYDYWWILEELQFSAGLAYDQVDHPRNFRGAPIVPGKARADQWSPKAGAVYTPTIHTTVRGGYSRSLGGVVFDQSLRLEPSQVAGFTQTYRSLMPESVVGSVSAEAFEIWGVGLEHRFPTRTRVGLAFESLGSEVRQSVGTFNLSTTFPFDIGTAETRQDLQFRENNLAFTLSQLVGELWSFGVQYRWSRAVLDSRFPEIPLTVSSAAQSEVEADLQQVLLFGAINHAAGPFARLDGRWTQQQNRGYTPARPTEAFWQLDAFLGWRFPGRKAEFRAGVLNVTGQDYRLNPLNYLPEARRDRTFVTSLRLAF
jgi:outer membrane receptor protein involved in Fe transport/Tfp pilus assembly protein PilF